MYPIATAPITAVVHPLRRYALIQSHEPLIFTALIGPISLMALAGYYVTPNWQREIGLGSTSVLTVLRLRIF